MNRLFSKNDKMPKTDKDQKGLIKGEPDKGSIKSPALEHTYKRYLQCSLTSFNKDNLPTKIYIGKHNQKLLPTHWKHTGKKDLIECVVWVSDPSTIIYRIQSNQDVNLVIDLNDFIFIKGYDVNLQKEFMRILILCAGFLGENTRIIINLSNDIRLNDTIRGFLRGLDVELNLNTKQYTDHLEIEQKLNPPEMFDAFKLLSRNPKKALTAIHNEIYPETVFLLTRDSSKRIYNMLEALSGIWCAKDTKNVLKTIKEMIQYEMVWINRNYYLTLKVAENKSGIIPITIIKWVRLLRAIGKNLNDIIDAVTLNNDILKSDLFIQGFKFTQRLLKKTIGFIEDSLDNKAKPSDMIINLFETEMALNLYKFVPLEPELQTIISDLKFLVSQIATLNKYLLYQERSNTVQVNSDLLRQIQEMKKMIFISKFDKNFLNIPTKIQRTLDWKKEIGKSNYEDRESTMVDMYMSNNDTIVFQKPNISTLIGSIDLGDYSWPSFTDYANMIRTHGIKLDEDARTVLYKNTFFEVLKTLILSASLISTNVDVNIITSTDPELRNIQLEACERCSTYVNGQNINKQTASGYLFSFRTKRKTIQSIFFGSLINFEEVHEKSKRFFDAPGPETFTQMQRSIENAYNVLSNNYASIASISVSRGSVKLFIYFMSLRMYKIGSNLKQSCEEMQRILNNKELASKKDSKDLKQVIELVKDPFLGHLRLLTNITDMIKQNQTTLDTTKEFTNLSFTQLIEVFKNLESVQEEIKTNKEKRLDIVRNQHMEPFSTEISNINSYIYFSTIHIESFCKAIIYLNKKNLFVK